MTEAEALARVLRALRLQVRLTERQVARSVGCTNASVRAFERGQRLPSRAMFARLCALYRADPNDALGAVVRLTSKVEP